MTSGARGASNGPASRSEVGNTRLSLAFCAALPSTSDLRSAVYAPAPTCGLIKLGVKILKLITLEITLGPFAAYTVTEIGRSLYVTGIPEIEALRPVGSVVKTIPRGRLEATE